MSALDARNKLLLAIEDNQPLAESINQANMLNSSRSFVRVGSDFESIAASDFDRSSTFNLKSKPV
jgi:hypothetical protein